MAKNKSSKKERFVACRKNSDGTLKEFKSNTGKVYDYEMALEAVENGEIENVDVYANERKWKIHVFFDTPLDFETYRSLNELIHETFSKKYTHMGVFSIYYFLILQISVPL